MQFTEIIPFAFVMGLVGSLHCLGMCGPLAMSLPMAGRNTTGRLTGAVLYNLGRVTTYTCFGLVLGMAGGFLITPKLQSGLSIAFGAAILLYVLLPYKIKKTFTGQRPANGVFLNLRKGLAGLLSSGSNQSIFGIGLLNGLLPCGMIYLALSTSFLVGSQLKGGLFMATFGAGTFPAMFAAAYFGSFVKQQMRLSLRKLIPVFMVCMAVLLMLRGLNLGIPYLSPFLPTDIEKAAVMCH